MEGNGKSGFVAYLEASIAEMEAERVGLISRALALEGAIQALTRARDKFLEENGHEDRTEDGDR